MPKNTRKNRRYAKPNVFVQSNQPDDADDIGSEESESSSSVEGARVRARVQRTLFRATASTEIYTRSLSAELKKMGALSGAVILVLVVLTFAL